MSRPIAILSGLAFLSAAGTAASTDTKHATAPRQQSHAENKRTVEAAFGRWAAGGTGFFDELLAENVVWTIKGSGPSAGTFRSKADFVAKAVRPFADRLAVPVRPVSTRVWADGDHVIVNWDGQGVARDGAPYRNSYAWIFRMADGKVVEATAFLDLAPYDDVLRRVPSRAPQESD